MALVLGLIQVFGTRAAQHNQPLARPLDLVGYLLLIAGPAALLLRHRYRVPTMIIAMAVTVTYIVLGYAYGPVFLALLAAAIGTVMAGYRQAAWIVTGVGYLIFVFLGHFVTAIGGYRVDRPSAVGAVVVGAWALVTLAASEAIRNRARTMAEVARTRVEQQRTRAEQQRRQTSEERLQMARELHDVLGHHLSLINVQAGVGLHLMDERPEQARAALAAIKQASAEALREVRSVLGVLRPEDEQAPRAPAPSLANLDSLVDASSTTVVIEGERRDLPAELDRAAYRIAQEALTNVRRHAGTGAVASIMIGYGKDTLTVRVDDDGAGVDGGLDEGTGLAGMRARATALGGTLTAGPGPTGGFRVEATLPLPGTATGSAYGRDRT